MKNGIRIMLVLTAGALTEIYDSKGKRVAFWLHWPFFKKRIKKMETEGKVRNVYKERLKKETVARLQKALKIFAEKNIHLVICTGGYSPARKKVGVRDSVRLMNDWLVADQVDRGLIIGGEATSVDTETNMIEFMERLKRIKFSRDIAIYMVTSWYHIPRAKIELKKALKKEDIEAKIISVAAFPELEAETLKYEYLWNLLTEPIKIIGLVFPWIKLKMREREYEVRNKK